MSKQNREKHTEVLLSELDCNLPTLDFSDEPSHFSSKHLREQFGVKLLAISYRETATKAATFDARRLKNATDCLAKMPASLEYVHILCGQEFCGFDLLPVFLKLTRAKAFQSLTLTTLGFSRDNLDQLGKMIQAREIPPARLKILCGDFFRRADPHIWDIGRSLAADHGFGFRSMRNHTKLILAQIRNAFYVVESSANLRSCHNLETFTVTQSPSLFEFHTGWINQAWKLAKE
jgi:hypothetical protein